MSRKKVALQDEINTADEWDAFMQKDGMKGP